jgi:hypothetical protein
MEKNELAQVAGHPRLAARCLIFCGAAGHKMSLLASSGWAERAAALGWDALALFGCCRHRPSLSWRETGRVFDRRRLEAGNVKLPWIGALRSQGGGPPKHRKLPPRQAT